MEFSEGKSRFLAIFYLVFFLGFTSALHGTTYNIELEPVQHAIISAYSNGNLLARAVSDASGKYEMDLPDGDYRIVSYKIGTDLVSVDDVRVSGDQEFDIILLTNITVSDVPAPDIPGLGSLNETGTQIIQTHEEYSNNNPDNKPSETEASETGQPDTERILLRILVVLLFIFLVHKFSSEGKKKTKSKKTDEELVLDMIRERGEMRQKELVKLTGWSEAKVSLVLKELKRKGLIGKKKVGREKIVFIKAS